jgi:hypothetical protein
MTDRELIDTLRSLRDALNASDKVQGEDELADWFDIGADRIEALTADRIEGEEQSE